MTGLPFLAFGGHMLPPRYCIHIAGFELMAHLVLAAIKDASSEPSLLARQPGLALHEPIASLTSPTSITTDLVYRLIYLSVVTFSSNAVSPAGTGT